MEELETSSTSARTAECSPIVLRETGRVRLVFRPTLVLNEAHPKACIKGDFVYEKKAASGQWLPANTVSLAKIKAGEQYKLEIHSAELLELMETLGPLYRARWQEAGNSFGRQTYVRMEAGLARFVRLGQQELETFLNAHPQDALKVLSKLVQWLSVRPMSEQTSKALSGIDAASLPAVSALLGLSVLKAALEDWEANASNHSEAFWQTTFARHSFVLSQMFAHPVVIIRERAYLGGKALDDTGGSYLDFLAASSATEAVALVEIKTPQTPLLGPEYRTGAFPPSTDLVGGIAQVLKYRSTFAKSFEQLAHSDGRDLVLGGAPCLVIAGNAKRDLLTPEQRESFEAFRSQLSSVRVVTYDELFAKLRMSAQLLEGIAGASAADA